MNALLISKVIIVSDFLEPLHGGDRNLIICQCNMIILQNQTKQKFRSSENRTHFFDYHMFI